MIKVTLKEYNEGKFADTDSSIELNSWEVAGEESRWLGYWWWRKWGHEMLLYYFLNLK